MVLCVFFFQAEDGIRDDLVTGVQTCALPIYPEVLLLDEPASALDPASTARIEDLIFELKRDYTIVIVTHNMQQAARVSDVTAFFFQGRLIEAGPTGTLDTPPPGDKAADDITGRLA